MLDLVVDASTYSRITPMAIKLEPPSSRIAIVIEPNGREIGVERAQRESRRGSR